MKKRAFLTIFGSILLSTGFIGIKSPEKIFTKAENEYRQTFVDGVENVDVFAENHLDIQAKSAYLMNYDTGTCVYALNETKRLPIASMCKIMTLTLCFEAIDQGNLTFDEEICISEKASSMGGSQVFLEANAKYPARELIKSIVVCSANDSCVAMAERICGSEELFIEKMNEKAKQLGATDTLFANCTGLPKEPQYSTAKDVSLMLKELLTHKEYYEFGKVWLDKFTHPQGRYTEITNTNKLVRFYDGCDGGKTGFTNQAGFCLAATAKRNNMRMISVVIGEENSKTRFNDVKKMFDFAFANYTMTPIIFSNQTLEKTTSVSGGKTNDLKVRPSKNAYVFTKRGEKANTHTEVIFKPLRAPIKKGERVGDILLFKDNIEIERISLVAENSIEKANYFDCIKEIAKSWTARK